MDGDLYQALAPRPTMKQISSTSERTSCLLSITIGNRVNDGYRILASKTQLLTRNKKDATDWYPEITQPLGKLKGTFVLDTEVCVLDEKGVPDFELMRTRGKYQANSVFDLLSL